MQGHDPIAIIGLSYRAPGVGRKGLWDYLSEAKSAWSKIPTDRFDYDSYHFHDKDKAGCISASGGHFLPDDIYSFDAPFFNLRAEEARAVDPQHRILLECTLEAAESAGVSLLDLAKSNTGVFSAIGSPEHGHMMGEDIPSSSTWTSTGGASCMFANRLSYFFDLTGPSLALDTACASSTYAVHIACQSLLAGECDSAFVGGAALLLGPGQWSFLDTMGALSPEGKSFSYDSRASGFGRGEGAACLLIKRLDDAVKCGDPIQAVIRNSACNHGGRSEGITMPSRSAQEQLLWRVHREIGLDPAETPVVEGHGTGTKVGDPIEAGSFTTVLASARTLSDPLYIGSLKSNFGHLEGASGILGMIKAILMLQHGYILPNANFESFNPRIEGREKLRIATTTVPWPKNAEKRVCVTNFGFGGSNAAIILDKGPESPHLMMDGQAYATGTKSDIANGCNGHSNGPQNNNDSMLNRATSMVQNSPHASIHSIPSSSRQIYVLSAKSESSLAAYLKSLTDYLDDVPSSFSFMKDLSFTLGQRRTHYPYRVATVASSLKEVKDQLATLKPRKIRDRSLAFVFTGQGAQYPQMTAGLQRHGVFADAVAKAGSILTSLGATWSLKEELERSESESHINQPDISQPACTALQLALVLLLRSWGVEPTTVTGHSSGEIAAAFAADLISFKAAMAIAYFRGSSAAQLSRELSGEDKGAMLALGVGFEVASALLEENSFGYATIAAINSPQSVTVSGDESAIEKIQEVATSRGMFVRKLRVNVAYHSRHMEDVAETYLESIAPFCEETPKTLGDSRPLFISSVTGDMMDVDAIGATYWVQNLLKPVRFADSIAAVFSGHKNSGDEGQGRFKVPNVIVEIGPHSALKGPIKQTVDSIREKNGDQRQEQFTYLTSLVRGTDNEGALFTLAKDIFCLGSQVDLGAVNQTYQTSCRVLSDLPPYEWDRSTRYVLQSRITQAKLHPDQPYHPFLGWKSPYSEGNEVAFRQVFTLDEIPWIRDHNVGGHVIFPMTGYLSLAMEAVRRLASNCPSSILVQEFHAKRSLEIEEDEKIDMTTKLRPAATGTEEFSTTTWNFEILTWSLENGWSSHCHGQVQAQLNDLSMDSLTFKTSAPLIFSDQMKERSADLEYVPDSKEGTHYGPAFKRMKHFREGNGWTIMHSEIRDMDFLELPSYGSAITVDPPTLDTFLQGLRPFLEAQGEKSAVMPNYVSRLHISNKISAAEKEMIIVTRLLDFDTKAGTMRISVAAFTGKPDSLLPVVEWESVTFRALTSKDGENSLSNLPASYRWDIVPSLDHIPNDAKLLRTLGVGSVEEIEKLRVRRLNQVAVHFMNTALQEISGDDKSEVPSHLSSFRKWAASIVFEENKCLDGVDILPLVQKVSSSGGQGELLCAVGLQLTQILRGEVQPLEIMLKDDRLSRYYDDDMTNARLSHILASWVNALCDIKSDLRVLEIGAGTGSATLPVFEAISRGGSTLPDNFSYTYTDISTGFFEKARKKLAKWSQYITFKKLDISQDPSQQGFTLEDYDLVIASNVLHATPNMTNTIDHVRSLLRPNGKLVLLEASRHAPFVMPFALLPGWWLAEDEYRSIKDGPLLSQESWNRILRDRGFSGVDGTIEGFPGDPGNILNIMSTTRVGLSDSIDNAPITICGPLMDEEEEEFAQMVAQTLAEHLDLETSIKPFAELDIEEDTICLFIDSPRNSLFKEFSSETFEQLKNVLLNVTALLWVIPQSHTPDSDVIKGVLRTVRLENGSRNLLMLEDIPTTCEGASAILQLTRRLQDPELVSAVDKDFTWQKDMMYLPRYRPLEGAREAFASEAGILTRRDQPVWQDNVSFEMTVESAGSPDSIFFKRTDVLEQALGADEILVQVQASGVNFRDVLLVLGSIPWTRPGFEGSGKVLQIGSKVTDLEPGDRIFFGALNGGSFSTHIKLPSWRACKIPEGFTGTEAAGISVAYSTAVMSLMRIGRLMKGETLLIHAASGAVGQACIILARHIGAEVFATAGSATKREFLHTEFGIPLSNIFSSRTSDFRDGILAATDGKGVDVVVNSLSGNLLQETWAVMADFGRFVEIGKRDLIQNSYLPMRPFDRNITFTGVDLRTLFFRKPDQHKKCQADLIDLVNRKVIVPIRPVTEVPVSNIAVGLRKLQSGQNIGKVVISMGPNEQVKAECPPPLGISTNKLLRPDVTYLVTGGTGGIGLSLAPWFIENGARNVVLLGRSGSSRPEVQATLERYQSSPDVQMRALACDIGVRDDVFNVLQAIQDLPPVGGVIHGALFLKDKLLVNTSYQDWINIAKPRIQGAWNLHDLLPNNMDFFVALSSFISGSGNIGQPVYSGTASFYDSFAEHRNSLNQPTVSVALPVVLDVGYVADRNLTEQLKGALGAIISEAHLRTVIKGAIVGPSSGLNDNGKAISFSFAQGDDSSTLPWQCFHPRALVDYIRTETRADGTTHSDKGKASLSKGLQLNNETDPQLVLLDALMNKVSSITMIERDEIEPDAPLSNYSLDSLVSVELRNWIRRETGVELPLPKIVNAGNLRALIAVVLSRMETPTKKK